MIRHFLIFQRPIKLIFLLFFFFLADLWLGRSIALGSNRPEIINGELNLMHYDFERDGNIHLSGTWKFYPGKFLNADQVKAAKRDGYVKVPDNLKGQICGEDTLPHMGFGTYYLRIIISEADINKVFMIKTEGIHSASKVIINEKLIAYGGTISEDRENSMPELKMNFNEYFANTDTLHLIVQTSNFHMRKFGMLYPIELGLSKNIRSANTTQGVLNTIAIGGIFMMMLYHFVLYFLRKQEKLTLYFALSALVLTVHSISYNELYYDLLSEFGFEFQLGLRRIASFLFIAFSALFLYYAFPKEFHKVVLKVVVPVSLLASASIIFLPLRVNAIFLPLLYLIAFIGVVYFLYVILIAYKNKREGAGVLIIGILINSTFIINDVLHDLHIVQSVGHLTLFGFFVRTFTQSMLIAIRFNNAFIHNEALLLERDTLEKQNEEKDALIQEIHHRVKNNLQSMSSIIDMQIMSVQDNEQKKILSQTHSRITSMALVHEMLYTSDKLSQISAKGYIETLVSSIDKMINTEHIPIRFVKQIDDVFLNINNCISMGMLTGEVISNSIKYAFNGVSNPEVKISLYYERSRNRIIYQIQDNGIGLSEAVISGKKSSLGLRLISIFSRQLDADMKLRNDNGTLLRLKFDLKNDLGISIE